MAKILSIGPDPDILAERNRALVALGHEVRGAATRVDAISLAKSQRFDVVLLCNEFLPPYAGQLADELRPWLRGTKIIVLPAGPEAMSVDDIDDAVREKELRPRAA